MNIPVLATAIASGHWRLVLMFEEVLQAFGTQFSDGLAAESRWERLGLGRRPLF